MSENFNQLPYVRYCDEKDHPAQTRLVNGEIIAYELPLTAHGSAVIQVSNRWTICGFYEFRKKQTLVYFLSMV